MVVIKECFPSRMEFIADYLSKKRLQIEIQQQRKFNLSFIPRDKERVNPTVTDDIDQNEKSPQNSDTINKKTPVISSVHHEPKYVKNFNAFIEKTHQHLNKVLSINQKISDVHGIVTEIQKPELHKHFVFNESIPSKIDEVINPESKRPAPDYKMDDEGVTVEKSVATTYVDASCEAVSEKKPVKLPSKLNSRSSGHLGAQKKDSSCVLHTPHVNDWVSRSKMSSPLPSAIRSKTSRLNLSKMGMKPNTSLSVRSEGPKLGLPRKINQVASETSREPKMREEAIKEVRKRTPNTLTMPNKSITSRTMVGQSFHVDNQGSTSRRSGTNTSRSECSTTKCKKMTPIPVSVINLQL